MMFIIHILISINITMSIVIIVIVVIININISIIIIIIIIVIAYFRLLNNKLGSQPIIGRVVPLASCQHRCHVLHHSESWLSLRLPPKKNLLMNISNLIIVDVQLEKHFVKLDINCSFDSVSPMLCGLALPYFPLVEAFLLRLHCSAEFRHSFRVSLMPWGLWQTVTQWNKILGVCIYI